MTGVERDRRAAELARIALEAAVPVMNIYEQGASARLKDDATPVTEADEAAERAIFARLAEAFPGVPILSEEAVSRGERPRCGEDYLLVDPVDGTREFLAHNGEFAVNLALLSGETPIAGAICAPALGKLWFAGATAFGVNARAGEPLPAPGRWRKLYSRTPSPALEALISRSHLDARTLGWLDEHGVAKRRAIGSSIKFALLAEGEADVYPRFGKTMLWDVAAGDAILRAAGGGVVGEDGAPMTYSPDGDLCNAGFVAWGRAPR